MSVIVCNHHWREWSYYIQHLEGTEPFDAKWRSCKRCDAVQRNDEPEPRTVLMRIEEDGTSPNKDSSLPKL